MADRISMDDFNESLAKAITDETQERVELVELSLSLPTKGKYRGDLKFSDRTKADLKGGFIAAFKDRTEHDVPEYFIEGNAEGFVSMLERYAQGMEMLASAIPDKYKRRQELLGSVSKQAMRLAEVIEELDGEALGWLLATLETSSDLKADPFRAVTLARARKQELLELLPRVSQAAQTASDSLPPHNFTQSEPKLLVAKQLEQTFWQEGIIDLFTPSKSGFAYRCLLEVFALAGEDAGEPAYWIKKAREHPDSMTAMVKKYKKA